MEMLDWSAETFLKIDWDSYELAEDLNPISYPGAIEPDDVRVFRGRGDEYAKEALEAMRNWQRNLRLFAYDYPDQTESLAEAHKAWGDWQRSIGNDPMDSESWRDYGSNPNPKPEDHFHLQERLAEYPCPHCGKPLWKLDKSRWEYVDYRYSCPRCDSQLPLSDYDPGPVAFPQGEDGPRLDIPSWMVDKQAAFGTDWSDFQLCLEFFRVCHGGLWPLEITRVSGAADWQAWWARDLFKGKIGEAHKDWAKWRISLGNDPMQNPEWRKYLDENIPPDYWSGYLGGASDFCDALTPT